MYVKEKERYVMKNILCALTTFLILLFFVGCSSSSSCKNDSDCPKGSKCINEKCYSGAITPDPQVIDPNTGCLRDDECGVCKRCNDGICVPIEGCDAGMIAIDASRDIIKSDSEDIEDAGDVEDVEDATELLSDIGDIESDAGEDAGDTELSDMEDVGTDISDVSTCDVSATLVVTKRDPTGDLPRGVELKILGQGFDNECGTLSVNFTGDSNPARVTEITSGYIKVIVPGFAVSGDITVRSFGQEARLTGSNSYKLQRRLFFTEYGNSINPGKNFHVLTFPNFLDFKNGKYASADVFPFPVLLDPYNLLMLIVSKDTQNGGFNISLYNFADVSFIKSISNNSATDVITGAKMDYENGLIYIVSKDGNLYVYEMGSLNFKRSIPIGIALYGIDIDTSGNRIFISGVFDTNMQIWGPPNDYKGALFVLKRDTLETDKIVTFGDMNSIGLDVAYNKSVDKVFVLDYSNGMLFAFNGKDYNSEIAPKNLGNGPMKIAFGKDMSNIYVVLNDSAASPKDATAILRGFNANDLTEITGSPFDTRLVTSTSSDNSNNQVNLIYDDLDGYLIVVSNADNRIAVIRESDLSFILSPEFTKTGLLGNFGIVVEDW